MTASTPAWCGRCSPSGATPPRRRTRRRDHRARALAGDRDDRREPDALRAIAGRDGAGPPIDLRLVPDGLRRRWDPPRGRARLLAHAADRWAAGRRSVTTLIPERSNVTPDRESFPGRRDSKH